jgi:hypothetical protein
MDSKMFPYKIFLMYKLSVDKEMRLQFAAWAEGRRLNSFQHMDLGWAYFYFEVTVNKQNMPLRRTEPPVNALEDSSNRRKVAVWAAMSSQGLIGPIFF